uniref:hypothetical protein n=1 Tax=Neoroseomonas rubea TaxID=2748666 RepID=UPI0018E06122
MPRKSLSLGPLRASIAAGRDGAEVSLALGGPPWRAWYARLANRRRAARDQAWAAPAPAAP